MAAAIRCKFAGFTRQIVDSNLFRAYIVKTPVPRVSFHLSAHFNAVGQEIKMPSLSPTMTEGVIIKWLKKEGDTISAGDVLCEIQTDKAVMSFETEEEGILAKILIGENVKDIKVGTSIALMVAEGEDWKTVEMPSGVGASSQAASEPSSGGNVPGMSISMPSLSPTMTAGTIVKWIKKEGDVVSPGDVLCEIQTDKAVMSFETEEEGILAKIIIPEGTTDVKVGTLIAVMVGSDEDWQNVQIPGASAATQSPSATQTSSGTVPGVNISMPSLSPTMTEGTIVKWYKKEGDTIAPGDVLCDIQTDKAVMSFETEEEGILAKILYAEGSSGVKVGSLIALMVAEGENWQDVIIPSSGESVKPESSASAAPPASTPASHKPTNYGPAVRTLLDLYQLDSSQISPTGKNKKILKSDVLQYINDRKLQPKPPLPVPLPGKKVQQESIPSTPRLLRPVIEKFIDIELSSMRKTIAKRLTESKMSIPHAYATVDCDIDLLLSFRKQLKSAGVTVSVNDFVIKAVALALKECPLVNCLYVKDQAIPAPGIDVSVAVATDSGLITPIVKNANVKTIDEISTEVKELAKRARDGKLQLHEFQGGSFTISNLGMFGITEFSAIINPPQCGILAVGGGQPYIDINGKTVTKMTSTLSYDARAISESAAADFLETLQILLHNPANLLLGLSPKKQRAVAR